MAIELTQEQVRDLLHYDTETGVFTRRKSVKGYNAGSVCGCVALNGYVQITVAGTRTTAHRLAFFYMTGEWPPNDVDHINRDRADNRWANLRPATRAENMWNTTTKNCGVHRHGERWRAQIRSNGKREHLGVFDSVFDAMTAYVSAAKERAA